MDLSQLPPGNAPGLAYNSLQNGTIIAFGVTYALCTLFIALRYVQATAIVKKVELDLVILTLAYLAALVYFVTMVTCESRLLLIGCALPSMLTRRQ